MESISASSKDHRPLLVLLAIVAGICVAWFLRATYSISMPLALGVFVATLVYPVQVWLNRFLPRWVAVMLTFLLVVLVAVGFLAGLFYLMSYAQTQAGDSFGKINAMLASIREDLTVYGLPLEEGEFSIQSLLGQVQGSVMMALGTGIEVGLLLLLATAFLVLSLIDAKDYRQAVRDGFTGDEHGWGFDRLADGLGEAASGVRKFIGVKFVTSFLSGLLVAGYCLVIGLPLWYLWGLLMFMLNFVPNIGSILAGYSADPVRVQHGQPLADGAAHRRGAVRH